MPLYLDGQQRIAGVCMIDTVWLTTNNFGLLSDNRMETIQHIKNTGACSEKKVCNISSNKEEMFVAKRKEQGLPAQGNITIHDMYGAPLCLFNISLPKMLYGHSLAETTPADFDKCTEGIHRLLTFAGVDIDRSEIENMSVARIDLCRNITVEKNISEYLYMIDNCTMPYAEKVPQKAGTVLLRNDSWQFTAYDKKGEVLQDTKQRIAAGLTKDTPHDTLRFEYRIMRGANVRRILARHTFKECFDLDMSRKALLTNFEKLKLDTAIKQTMDSSQLEYLFRHFSRVKVEKYIAAQVILQQVNNDLNLLRSYLKGRYSERQTRNIVNEYRAWLYEMNIPAHNDLFNEMRSKLAA